MTFSPRPNLPQPYHGPSGSYDFPSGFILGAANTVTSGTAFWLPHDVGPSSRPYAGLSVNVTTAQVAGTTTTTLGLFLDDGSGGMPNVAAGAITSGTVVLTTLAIRTLGSTFRLAPGRYWSCFIYVASVAPSTAAQVTCLSNSLGLWNTGIATVGRTLSQTGQTGLPTTATGITATAGANSPLVCRLAA